MAYYEYKNHKNGPPEFVTHGGSFYNPQNFTYVTYIPDNIQYYIPDTLVELTKQEVKQRALNVHSSIPYKMIDVSDAGDILRDMTDAEVEAWCDQYFLDMEADSGSE